MASMIGQLDSLLAETLSAWNIYTTVIAGFIVLFAGYSIFAQAEPDLHPMLLLRQASAAFVRLPGESAVYRSPEIPHGYPLRTGLNVKPPNAPAYAGGKDGDLRDVWKRVSGALPLEIKPAFGEKEVTKSEKGKILTVFGKDDVVEHDLKEVENEIGSIGKLMQEHGIKKVAVYLPNSIELLAAIFAGSFYGFSPILIPYNQPHEAVLHIIKQTGAESLIAEAGSVPLEYVGKAPSLKSVVWVVEKTSRHMDWTEVPEDVGGRIDVSTWHELVKDNQGSGTNLPETKEIPPSVVVWEEESAPPGPGEAVEYSQQNLVAAIGALISALPSRARLTPSDLFLPADCLCQSYTLCLTLAALFCHSTVAVNSVAGPGVALEAATRSISPTVIAVSPETAERLHSESSESVTSGSTRLAHWAETRALQAGALPASSFITKFIPPFRASLGATPGKLRIVFVAERVGRKGSPLSSATLSDLRIYTGSRVVYALTARKIAGAIAQTNIYDYRREDGQKAHFGTPLSSVEIKLVDTPSRKTTDEKAEGKIVVQGPSVVGGKLELPVEGTFRDDCTLAYV